MLDRLQNSPEVNIDFIDQDPVDVSAVDDKLITLAMEMGGAVVTNDYNLNRVARLQGVPILNINELANAVKSVFLPGEEIPIKIIQEGKEAGQGVGYLEDGTMVVVENGRRYVNQTGISTSHQNSTDKCWTSYLRYARWCITSDLFYGYPHLQYANAPEKKS